ncbi:MAG TPA: UbiA family prenyltransferase [Bacteroidales bacterium]|jgi:1,4-dihydroxy-2-naphthoate octaprenyltransferase|nr:UbiA family prenyltransferase [Bacteroidales bacterium]
MVREIPVLSWFDRSTVKHLRLSFSFFLLPVFLFALSQSAGIQVSSTILGFVILHILLFPSTNGYNSYQDKDVSSIGGLKHPPKVTENLYYATLSMESAALITGLFISVYFSLMLLVFIIMSHLYSYRRIRLKKYPFVAFIVVFIFQGGFVYLMSLESMNPGKLFSFFTAEHILCMIISSLFMGSMYPLTQIYQHKADKDDGVISLSYRLGYNGTFIFSGFLFTIAVILFFIYLAGKSQYLYLFLFLLFIIPVVLRLLRWFSLVKKDIRNADFENTMAVNLLSSVCMNLYFVIIAAANQILIIK